MVRTKVIVFCLIFTILTAIALIARLVWIWIFLFLLLLWFYLSDHQKSAGFTLVMGRDGILGAMTACVGYWGV